MFCKIFNLPSTQVAHSLRSFVEKYPWLALIGVHYGSLWDITDM